MKVTIPYDVFLALFCAASLAVGYLDGGKPTPAQREISGKLKQACAMALEGAEYA